MLNHNKTFKEHAEELYEASSIPGLIQKVKNVVSGIKATPGFIKKQYSNKPDKPNYKD